MEFPLSLHRYHTIRQKTIERLRGDRRRNCNKRKWIKTMKLIFKLSVYMASIDLALSWCLPHHPNTKNRSTRRTVTLSLSSMDDGRSGESKKSIADYTLGLHGGKYQFGDSSGFSSAGQEFAASLYSSVETQPVDYASEDLPNWAVRLSELSAECLKLYSSSIQPLPADGKVTIVNDEMTWERYYAFVVPRGEQSTAVSVEPWVGMLAPRGGQETLQVTPSSLPSSGPTWLVVGTETERWIYSL